MQIHLTRRRLLAGAGAAAAGLAAGVVAPAAAAPKSAGNQQARRLFGYCLNTSTIRGSTKTLPERIDIAAKAGYDAIEPWMREINEYIEQGGKLSDLRKRIDDAGLKVPSAIGFSAWIVDDDATRAAALESAHRDMEMVREIGGTRIAAPPVGATKQQGIDLLKAAQRYRALLEVGDKVGVVPQVEVWGFSTTLGRLGESLLVAVESRHPRACLLPDVYHLYKGGSDFAGLRLIDGAAMHVFHMNDYPADPPRDKIGDAQRVYPGDGVAPLGEILQTLRDTGFRGMLSLELFSREYWQQDPLLVAKKGLEKMQAAVDKALA